MTNSPVVHIYLCKTIAPSQLEVSRVRVRERVMVRDRLGVGLGAGLIIEFASVRDGLIIALTERDYTAE